MSRLIATSVFVLALPLLIGCGARGDSDVQTGLRLIDQRKFEQAIPHLERGLEKPLSVYSRSDVYTAIGNCYNEMEQFEKSLEFHGRAIKEDPKNHQAYTNQGIVYRLMGDYDKASQSYTKALELAPDYAELHASMGALAVFQGDSAKAIKHLERSIELDGSLAVSHSNLALAYATVGRFDDADKQLKKAVSLGYHQPQLIRERIDQLRDARGSNR